MRRTKANCTKTPKRAKHEIGILPNGSPLRLDRTILLARRQLLEVSDKLKLGACLWAAREAAALVDGLPLRRNDLQRLLAVLRHPALDEPAPDHRARAPDAATAVHRRLAPAPLAVVQHVHDARNEVHGFRDLPIRNREAVVLDGVHVGVREPTGSRAAWEQSLVLQQLARLREVDECAHARAQQGV